MLGTHAPATGADDELTEAVGRRGAVGPLGREALVVVDVASECVDAGVTSGPTGTIDAETGAFVLEWTSQIEGGAFNEFSGVWHLEGTFTAA